MFVGDGDEGFVIADPAVQSDDPLLESRAPEWLSFERNLQSGARALGEQSTQVAVAVLGDYSETLFAAGAILTRHESRPGRQLATVLEIPRVRHGGQHRTGRELTDAGEFAQALGRLVLLHVRMNASIALGDTLVQTPQMFECAGEDRTKVLRQSRILTELRQLPDQHSAGPPDPHTNLRQQSSRAVQQSSALNAIASARA